METYIKYKRIVKECVVDKPEFQEFLDELIKDGWHIISYDEKLIDMFNHRVTLLVGKRQDSDLKNIL